MRCVHLTLAGVGDLKASLTDHCEVDTHIPGGRGLEIDPTSVLVLVAGGDGVQHEARRVRGHVKIGALLQRVLVRPVLRPMHWAIATVDAARRGEKGVNEALGGIQR